MQGSTIYDQQFRSRFEWLRDPDPDVGGSELVFPVRRLAPDGVEAWAQVIERGYEGYVAKDPATSCSPSHCDFESRAGRRACSALSCAIGGREAFIAVLEMRRYARRGRHGPLYVGAVEVGLNTRGSRLVQITPGPLQPW